MCRPVSGLAFQLTVAGAAAALRAIRGRTAFPFHPPVASLTPSGGHLRGRLYDGLL